MKKISNRDFDTILRVAKTLTGARHDNSRVMNAMRQIIVIANKWSKIQDKENDAKQMNIWQD